MYLATPLPAYELTLPPNSPSKVAASEKPDIHLTSAEAVVSTLSRDCAAPFTTKLAPGNVWIWPAIPFRSARRAG